MAVLSESKPEKVFRYFEEICRIPHGSGNTKELSDWLAEFAKTRGLEYYQDELNDIIIIKEATKGYENSEPVVLQGHMDMVCDKTADCTKDMDREGLDLAVDGDVIYAVNTTLGGDDGIAVAYMLALLDDDSLEHPRLETVFTVDEETGLYGAEAIDVSPLKGKRFINLDSEDEGILTVGCAGGVSAIAEIPLARKAYEGQAFSIALSGFIGGHSGMEIIKGQENALKVLGRLLFELNEKAAARIVTIEGGVADNVIPVSAKAIIVSPKGETVRALCDKYSAVFAHEFKVDPDFKLSISETDAAQAPFDAASSQKAIAYLCASPNGIQKMTFGIDGLPQTSLSLGILRTKEDRVEYTFCIRSSVDSECEMIARRLESLVKVMGGSIRREGAYPGWEFRMDSPLRDLVCKVYKEQSGRDMVIEAIHAGLECGFFAGKMPGLDCVSIGPDVRDVHTPNEKLYIGSVQRTWDLLVGVLARMK